MICACLPTFPANKVDKFTLWMQSTVEGLQLGYCVVPSARRFILLYSFLKRNLSKKVMVFFSSCCSVKYHLELLRHLHVDCFDIHGKQNQQKRTSTFSDFCEAEKGILLCTDVARGLDIPAVVCYNLWLEIPSLDMIRLWLKTWLQFKIMLKMF